jgi:hypothetical protein
MTQLFYTQVQIKKPITGITREHVDTLLAYLKSHHEDTGELPSAEAYLDMVRNAVENTPARQ